MTSEQKKNTRRAYQIETVLVSIEEKFRRENWTRDGYTDTSLGWFAVFQGSHEALFLSREKPTLRVGHPITIIIEQEIPTDELEPVSTGTTKT